MKRGMFITFEGVEGCGKSTQIARLQQHLETRGYSVVVTREPGGTPIAEAIRALLLDPLNHAMSPVAELLLYEAARAQHVAERIRPSLESGWIVLCDRFADSTTAYQGAGRGLSRDLVRRLHDIATEDLHPDLTLVIDVPADVGLSRATQTGSDRMEREAIEFHERVRMEFVRLANEEPARVMVIDGMQDVDAVARAIRALVDARLEAP